MRLPYSCIILHTALVGWVITIIYHGFVIVLQYLYLKLDHYVIQCAIPQQLYVPSEQRQFRLLLGFQVQLHVYYHIQSEFRLAPKCHRI